MNPKKLLQLQGAQRKALAKQGREAEFIPLATRKESEEPEGIDTILLTLIPAVSTVADLDTLTKKYREGKS